MLASACACLCGAAPPDGIPMDMAGGRAVIPMLLDGGVARMVLDTGAERTVITRAACVRLGLKFDPWVATTMQGAGGRLETHQDAFVHRATLGGVVLFQRPEQESLSLAVTELGLGGADGLLGGDILRHFTLDLDFPGGWLALRPADWPVPAGGVGLTALWPDLLLAPVSLDGQALTAVVDTGASISLINARGLHRLGLNAAALARDPAASTTAIGGRLPVRAHRFAELQLGGLALKAPVLLAAYVPEAAFDMILGLDVLAPRRIVISYAGLTLSDL